MSCKLIQGVVIAALFAGTGCGTNPSSGVAMHPIGSQTRLVTGTYEWTNPATLEGSLGALEGGGLRYEFSDEKVTIYYMLGRYGDSGQYLIKTKKTDFYSIFSGKKDNKDNSWVLEGDSRIRLPIYLFEGSNFEDGVLTGKGARELDDLIVGRPGEWISIFTTSDVEYGATTVSISWAKCQAMSACSRFKPREGTQIFDVKSDGKILTSPLYPEFIARKIN
jgi:hypothetical protein